MNGSSSSSQLLVNMASEADRPSTSKDYRTTSDIGKLVRESTIADKDVNSGNNDDSDSDNVICLSSDDSDVNLLEDEDISFLCTSKSETNLNSPVNVSKMQAIADESVGLRSLFKNHLMEPLTFLLMLHDFPLELKLTDLIEGNGGIVYKHVNQIDGCTAVMVKDTALHWSYLGPVFSIQYIQACFKSKRILNISQYFKSSIKIKFKNNFNFMKVVYFKKYMWETIPEKFLLTESSLNNRSDSTYSSSLVNLSHNTNNKDVIISSDEEDMDDRIKMPPPSSKLKQHFNKHSRMMYSRKEDEDILKYIVNNEGYDSLKGNLFWKILEKRNVCPKRTWQSVKERFLKKIVYNLSSFSFLTKKQIHLLQICAIKK